IVPSELCAVAATHTPRQMRLPQAVYLDRGRHWHVGVAGARSKDRGDLRLSPLGDTIGKAP
ncbi:MAG TPA: hypothetical protein VK577_23910, partial [Bradyrhizobium sp.]|nr:hypothetical protein [Bradyrhizobium sp.]